MNTGSVLKTKGFSTVAIADSSVDELWKEYLQHHPDSLIFHHPAWFAALEAENRRKVIRLISTNESGRISGLLPLLETRGIPFGFTGTVGSRRLSTLPRTPLCGPIADNRQIEAQLLKKALEICTERGVKLQCKSMNPDLNAEIPEVQRIRWRTSYVKFFPDSSESMRFGSPRNHRRILTSIRKAASSGISVFMSTNREEIVPWHRLYLETMRRHCVPARSLRFFLSLWDNLQRHDSLHLVVAVHSRGKRRKMVAGSIFLSFKKDTYYAFNGSDPEFFPLRPNDLLQWFFQSWAHRHGFASIDLGEVSDGNTGLRDFKRKWGTEERQIYHYYYPASPERRTSFGNVPLNSPLASLWQRVPVCATGFIGQCINWFL